MVSVADNGAGIPEDLRPHLFDPFVTTKRNGTGLGLALVAKMIGDHGGVIEFDSQPRPHRVPGAAAGASRKMAGGMSGGSTILIADDDRAIRTVLNQALARLGPRGAQRPATPRPCGAGSPDGDGDLVITDVVMPDENGLDLMPRIKKLRPDLRDHRDERAEHAADRGQGDRARRLRIPAQAVRPARAGRRRRARADRPARRLGARGRGRGRRTAAADRPLAGDAGDLPRPRPADGHRSDGDDHRRERHRQGAGRARAARLRQAAQRPVRRRSTWRRSRAS